ncbi:XXYS1_4_G0054440.mRNA.1.CDS.1 [Saccharomyces cerevisiae]|nr:EM14S01-3B_G0051770.mRNA.1.CDS.1 [Saccharomyces cerevisiae]CAD6620742.1 XXYS1_4_G0054440.mRNA.1.CDS.1 [Saccharomyces cerevisiae]CAI4379497.1 AMH_1a_G0025650.mRNA.1.CDS.1 [Saccharomyces cerevisiae]CAI4388797.1 CEI_1a_G0025580.mRNA.1.CDS.1 [Saccharomyces cerevisiae]CAI6594631.1 AMH_1a_G0025650.mRNA.1.CDS.1 [Saccharomyces cerevisiae]
MMLRLVTKGLPKVTPSAAKAVLVRGSLLHSFSTSARFNNSVAEDEAKIVLKDKNRPLRIDRELPDPTTERRKRIAGFVLFSVAIGSALSLIFNYEKTESPIISNTLYYIRRSPATKNILGESIEFDGIIPWVYGELNSVKGRINITFYIKGDKNVTGTVRLVADRNTHDEEFLIHEWSVTAAGQKIDLLAENTKTPI